MDNVVEWTISNVTLPQRRLVLERIPFRGGRPDTILSVPASANERFELFVRQVPVTEQHHPGSGGGPALGDLATHLNAFYDLLGVAPNPSARPIPDVSATVGFPNACAWVEKMTQRVGIMIHPSPTTVNCMVASALPES